MLSHIRVEFQSSRYNKKFNIKKMRNGNLEYSQFSLYIYKKHLLCEKITNNLKLLDSLGTLRKLHVYCTLNTLKVIFRWYKFSYIFDINSNLVDLLLLVWLWNMCKEYRNRTIRFFFIICILFNLDKTNTKRPLADTKFSILPSSIQKCQEFALMPAFEVIY